MSRPSGKLKRVSLFAAILTTAALVLSGCGGSDGAQGPAGPAGPAGATGPIGPSAVATVKANALTAEQWGALSLGGQVTNVDMSKGTPVISFKVTDAAGNPVTGLAKKDSAGSYPNFSFGIAKLIPVSATAPSRWVNYNVFGATPVAGKPPVLMFPEPENSGSMQDNGDGSYVYTSGLDITKAKSFADAGTFSATSVKADLDDLTYDASLPHRVLVAVGGTMPD